MYAKIIKNEEEYQSALLRMDEIFDAVPGTPEGDELELLSLLINNFESIHFPSSPVDPIAAIELVMELKGLKPKDLVGVIGDKTLVSRILSKKRKLTLEMIRSLHMKFNIPVELLLADYDLVP